MKFYDEGVDSLTFYSLVKALATELARKSLWYMEDFPTKQGSQNDLWSEPSSWVSRRFKHRTQSFT